MNRKKENQNEYPDISGIFDIDDNEVPTKPIARDRNAAKTPIREPILTSTEDIHTLPEEEQKKIKREKAKKQKEINKNKAKTRLIMILAAVVIIFIIAGLVRNAVKDSKKPVVTFEKPAIETITRYHQSKGVTTDYNGTRSAVFVDNNYDVHFIETGMKADIITDETTVTGTVAEIKEEAPDIPLIKQYYSILTGTAPETAVIAVYVTPDSPDALPAEDGKKISVKVKTKTAADAMTVPSEALNLNGSQYFVWLMEPARKTLTRQDVTVGISSDGRTQILAGLKKSDRVIITASCNKEKIYEGMQVKTD